MLAFYQRKTPSSGDFPWALDVQCYLKASDPWKAGCITGRRETSVAGGCKVGCLMCIPRGVGDVNLSRSEILKYRNLCTSSQRKFETKEKPPPNRPKSRSFWWLEDEEWWLEKETWSGATYSPCKTNGWNLKIASFEKGTSSSKPSFLGSMSDFRGCFQPTYAVLMYYSPGN